MENMYSEKGQTVRERCTRKCAKSRVEAVPPRGSGREASCPWSGWQGAMQTVPGAAVARSTGPSPQDEANVVHADPTVLREMQKRRDELEQAGQQGRHSKRGRSDERDRASRGHWA